MSDLTVLLEDPSDYIAEHFPKALVLESNLPQEVIDAGLECGIDPKDIDEAYCGEFENDREFAYEQADMSGALDDSDEWPRYCIDWDYAAQELMYDYSEHMGFYFRHL